MSPEVLQVLRNNLAYMHSDVDARFRNDFLSLIKRLLVRIRGGMMSLTRQMQRLIPKGLLPMSEAYLALREKTLGLQHIEEDIKAHLCFMKWYIRFLSDELVPTSTYQAQITALKVLTTMLQLGYDEQVHEGSLAKGVLGENKWDYNFPILVSSLERRLVDLLMNPFEDVRSGSATILAMIPSGPSQPNNASRKVLHLDSGRLSWTSSTSCAPVRPRYDSSLKRAARTMKETCRADHSDGYARLSELASREGLRDKLVERDSGASTTEHLASLVAHFEAAVEPTRWTGLPSHPLHGYLTGIR